LLNKFIRWANQFVQQPPDLVIEAAVTASRHSDNSSARLDFDTLNTMNRLTVWESGRYLVESIQIDSGHPVLEKSGDLSEETTHRLDKALESLVSLALTQTHTVR
jgi:hypothetical protein